MPIYEYRCLECGERFEKFGRSANARKEVVCPRCGNTEVQKEVSLFGLMGGVAHPPAHPAPPEGRFERFRRAKDFSPVGGGPGALQEIGMAIQDPQIKNDLIQRLRRIEGQVRGVARMINVGIARRCFSNWPPSVLPSSRPVSR